MARGKGNRRGDRIESGRMTLAFVAAHHNTPNYASENRAGVLQPYFAHWLSRKESAVRSNFDFCTSSFVLDCIPPAEWPRRPRPTFARHPALAFQRCLNAVSIPPNAPAEATRKGFCQRYRNSRPARTPSPENERPLPFTLYLPKRCALPPISCLLRTQLSVSCFSSAAQRRPQHVIREEELAVVRHQHDLHLV
jgi:hypothetical protein